MLDTATKCNLSRIARRQSWALGLAPCALLLSGCSVGVSSGVPGGDPSPPAPTQDTYDACSSDTECVTDQCWDVTVDYADGTVTDSMCTYGCSDDLECDYDGLCLRISSEPPLCYQQCLDDLDCIVGFACVADGFGYDPICLPW